MDMKGELYEEENKLVKDLAHRPKSVKISYAINVWCTTESCEFIYWREEWNAIMSTLCQKKHTETHMSTCTKVLDDGRYRWRHDQVLRTVANTVDAAIRRSNFKLEEKPIHFIKASECSLLCM